MNSNNKELNIIIFPDGSFTLEWSDSEVSLLKSSRLMQNEIYDRYEADPYSWLLFLGFCDKKIALSPSLSFFRRFAGLFTRMLSMTPDLETIRHNVQVVITEEMLDEILGGAPLMMGAEYLNREMLLEIWEKLGQVFSRLIKGHDGTVASFIKAYSPDVHLVGRVFFHLVENKDSDQPFAFLATYTTSINRHGKSKHLPLKHAIKEYSNDNEKMLALLSTVHVAAEKSPLISGLVETGELFYPLAWSAGEAYEFLREITLYEESGILCRIPDWWKSRSSGAGLNISMGDVKPSLLGMNAILTFKPQLMLGDLKISREEARRLLEESEGLAFIKNKWVAVDPEKLRQTLDAYEKARKMMTEEGLSIKDALRLQLNPDKLLNIRMEDVDVTISRGKWLESVVEKLRDPELTPRVKTGKGFKARLRKYQQKGLNWLFFLHTLRFGACLADDMGLGKTVQVLGFLNAISSDNSKPASLLIIPASLIYNWINEIEKFSPTLKYFTAHPEAQHGKKVPTQNEKSLNGFDLVITTYALAQKYDWLKHYSWDYVILDEAQAIKNPGTKQTRAVKKLSAQNRIIMTGTPVENRISDLWSLFDFLNPGLLGNKTEFGKFTKKLKNNPDGYLRLRRLISPYILRRLKTDKTVISDLPEKVEMKTYAHLSKKQVVLYKNMIMEIEEIIAETDGIKRKGLVLASLMKFKQLCNHPDQYLGTGDYEEKESGKFTRLREICETIYEKRERVLVFTQFKEIIDPLFSFLNGIFEREGLILHGSVPVGKRKKIIEQFQSDAYVPFMVLSLKAGGVGLNLTRANHVVHFDRWWNPAVENQATDRAFRIGQKKNVVVHKFLTKGTIEEKIDQMLEEKKELSEKVVAATGEAWITEMDNNELMDLFKLTL